MEEDPAAPTGTVSVEVAADGQPRFAIHETVAWDFIPGEGAGRKAVAGADAVCFGTLAQRGETSRRTIRGRGTGGDQKESGGAEDGLFARAV